MRVLLVVGALLAVVLIRGFIGTREERKVRAQHQVAYQAAFVSFSKDVKRGMSREKVEDLLREKDTVFSQRFGDGTWDDIITLGRESSEHWYCSYEDVIIRIPFRKVQGVNGYDAYPTDLAESPVLEPWLQDCL